jgi:hypothetical protein
VGRGLPWRPSAGAAGPPQKAAAPAGDRGFRVRPKAAVTQAMQATIIHEAQALSVRERVLLLCVASNTNWLHAGVPGETVTAMIGKGLITPDGENIALTDRGRAVVRAMLPEL